MGRQELQNGRLFGTGRDYEKNNEHGSSFEHPQTSVKNG